MENIQETEAVPNPTIQPSITSIASSPKLSFFTKRMKIFILLMMGIIAVGGVIAGYGVINIMQSSSLANSSSVPKLTAPLFKLNDLPELPFRRIESKVEFAQLPSDYYLLQFGVNDHYIYAHGAARGQSTVVIDGVEKQPRFSTGSQGYCFSSSLSKQGNKYGYVTCPIDNETKMELYVGDIRYGPYEWASEPNFSGDGKRFGAIAEKNNQFYVILDGKEGQPLDFQPSAPIFSPDGTRYSYIVPEEFPSSGKAHIVIDGISSESLDNVRYVPLFSSDSKHYSFIATIQGKAYVFVDGKPLSAGFDKVSFPVFGGNNLDIYYGATSNQQNYIMKNDTVIYGPFPNVYQKEEAPRFTLNKNMDTIAILVTDSNRPQEILVKRLNAPGQEEHILVNEYSKSVSQISLSPNGQTVGFVALNQEDEYMLINSTTQKIYKLTHEGNNIYWKDGSVNLYDDTLITFSNDSKKMAFIEQRTGDFAKDSVVVNGINGEMCDQVSKPEFSSDSRKISYFCVNENKIFKITEKLD
ncbi:MAG: hypothetical protein AAB856_03045 [Patescibacteria group bacterium]